MKKRGNCSGQAVWRPRSYHPLSSYEGAQIFSTRFVCERKNGFAIVNGDHYQIEYSDSALEDLDNLPARPRAQILRKLERLEHGLHGNIKRLHGTDAAFRLRMGDYRVLFDVEDDAIVVRRIGHRKDVYD